MKNLTEEQAYALEIVNNLLDDLDLASVKYDLNDSIEEELNLRAQEEEWSEEEAEQDDIYTGDISDFFQKLADELGM